MMVMNEIPTDRYCAKSLQFGTRSLLIGTAGCALIALVFLRFGAVAGVAVVWFLILAGAHSQAANAFGTRQTVRGATSRVSSLRNPSHDRHLLRAQLRRHTRSTWFWG